MYPETENMVHYVTVRDGRRTGFLLGPFRSRRDAEAHVDTVRAEASTLDSRTCFHGFGTARVTLKPGAKPKPGRLNARLGFPDDPRTTPAASR